MKPGNLLIQGAKSGGETKDEDSERNKCAPNRSERLFLWAPCAGGGPACVVSTERKNQKWKKDCLPLSA